LVVVVNKMSVPLEQGPAVVSAFARRAGDLRAVPGCLGFELWRASERELWAVSRWQSRPAYEAWRQSESFALAHTPAEGEGDEGKRIDSTVMLQERVLPAGP
jgi:heme-degrading monooxygenase HmoA